MRASPSCRRNCPPVIRRRADPELRLLGLSHSTRTPAGAIRAAGRCDVFMGTGPEVGELAGRTLAEGKLFYIFVKTASQRRPLCKPKPNTRPRAGDDALIGPRLRRGSTELGGRQQATGVRGSAASRAALSSWVVERTRTTSAFPSERHADFPCSPGTPLMRMSPGLALRVASGMRRWRCDACDFQVCVPISNGCWMTWPSGRLGGGMRGTAVGTLVQKTAERLDYVVQRDQIAAEDLSPESRELLGWFRYFARDQHFGNYLLAVDRAIGCVPDGAFAGWQRPAAGALPPDHQPVPLAGRTGCDAHHAAHAHDRAGRRTVRATGRADGRCAAHELPEQEHADARNTARSPPRFRTWRRRRSDHRRRPRSQSVIRAGQRRIPRGRTASAHA